MMIRTLSDLTLDRFTLDKMTLDKKTLDMPPFAAGHNHDAYTKLMLHFNKDFADDSQLPKTVTAYGHAQISTAQNKFGGASAYFDGNGDDYLSVPNSADFNLSTGDFTFDFWVYPTVYPTNTKNFFVLSARAGVSNPSLTCKLTSLGKIAMGASSGTGLGTSIFSLTGVTNVPLNTWSHIAVIRNGQYFKCFINGVEDTALAYTSTAALKDSVEPFVIGAQLAADAEYYYKGYIDEFRFSKGIARWTSNFTPPTSEYTT